MLMFNKLSTQFGNMMQTYDMNRTLCDALIAKGDIDARIPCYVSDLPRNEAFATTISLMLEIVES